MMMMIMMQVICRWRDDDDVHYNFAENDRALIQHLGWSTSDGIRGHDDDTTLYLNTSGTFTYPSSMLPAGTPTTNPLDQFSKSEGMDGGKELVRKIGYGNCPVLEERGVYDLDRSVAALV